MILGRNFILLTVTTMFIITVVKSSLALSLGLVGALSIIRFRTAIKEPEELTYIFLCIAIGLGLGADQRIITIIAFLIVILIIYIKHFFHRSVRNQNLYFSVTSKKPKRIKLEDIISILKRDCASVNLKRFDETKDLIEASFLVEFDNPEQLKKAKTSLQKIDSSVKITFMDNNGIF